MFSRNILEELFWSSNFLKSSDFWVSHMALGFIFWIVVVCWILVKCKSAWVRGLFTQFGQTNFVALPLSSFRRPFLYIGNLYSLRSLSAGGASLPYKARRNKPGYGFNPIVWKFGAASYSDFSRSWCRFARCHWRFSSQLKYIMVCCSHFFGVV